LQLSNYILEISLTTYILYELLESRSSPFLFSPFVPLSWFWCINVKLISSILEMCAFISFINLNYSNWHFHFIWEMERITTRTFDELGRKKYNIWNKGGFDCLGCVMKCCHRELGFMYGCCCKLKNHYNILKWNLFDFINSSSFSIYLGTCA